MTDNQCSTCYGETELAFCSEDCQRRWTSKTVGAYSLDTGETYYYTQLDLPLEALK